MRTAICFFGQPRYLEQCIDNLSHHLITPNKADIFFHFWENHPVESHYWMHNEDVLWPILSKERIKDLLKPENYLFEPQRDFDCSLYVKTNCPTYNVLSWTYSSKMCHNLYDRNEYDVIIHCRTDLFFHGTPVIKFPQINDFFVEHRGTSGDQFAYGSVPTMQDFSTLHDHLPSLYQEVGVMHSESMLKKHMQNSKRNIQKAECVYSIWRHGR